MKKIILLASFLILSLGASAQVKLGLRFAPNLALNRVQGSNNLKGSGPAGPAVRYSFGGIADFFFAPNYAFSTGLWFTTKRSSFKYESSVVPNDDRLTNGSVYSINEQYLQIPLSIKFYTNEVAPDMRIYFQLGGTIDAMIAEKRNDGDYIKMDDDDENLIRPLDIGALVGAGAELVMGENTILFGGINYNRGLINQMQNDVAKDIRLNNDLLAIEVGIKF